MSSRFLLVSAVRLCLGRTLQVLRDATGFLAFSFEILEEGPSPSLKKGESAYMYGDRK